MPADQNSLDKQNMPDKPSDYKMIKADHAGLQYHHAFDVITKMIQLEHRDEPYILAIITRITGGAMRARGAMMLITADAAYGYISEGCIDGDIIFQAREMLKDDDDKITGHEKNKASAAPYKILEYGAASPIKDLQLPCGGQIETLLSHGLGAKLLTGLGQTIKARAPLSLSLHGYEFYYYPPIRLRIIGTGPSVITLALQAQQAGFSVIVQSPSSDIGKALTGLEFHPLTDPLKALADHDDDFTAVVTLFHDHDWEPEILQRACDGPAFYIGAMGSARAHQKRLEKLTDLGMGQADIAKIHAPIGLIRSMRDGQFLAISILAQITQKAQQCQLI